MKKGHNTKFHEVKNLVKPVKSFEDFRDEVIEAFCDHDGCSPNCKVDWGTWCVSVNSDETEEDIIF